LRIISVSKTEEVKKGAENYKFIIRSFTICTLRQILLGRSNQGECHGGDVVTCMVQAINAYRILDGKREGKSPIGKPRHKWEGNVKMNHNDIGCEGVDSIQLAQYKVQWRAFVTTIMKLGVTHRAGNFLTSSSIMSFSMTLVHGVKS
jgi:hypothetical protein